MLILFFILVLLLHVWFIIWQQFKLEEPITEAKPLVMEVSMIAIPASKPNVTPPSPPPPTPTLRKPEPVKPVLKPVPAKPSPVVTKPVSESPVENSVPAPTATQTPAPSTTTSSATSVSTNAPTEEETFTQAAYASKPDPEYPSIARSREWEGKVVLRLQVSAEGIVENVTVDKTSGHDILDESAIETVKKKWRLIPAKRGSTPVATSVLVPIKFYLTEHD
jgi:protein TonB